MGIAVSQSTGGGAITDRVYNSMSSGVIAGGEMTINGGDPAKFDISDGNGCIIDSWTDPDNPVQYDIVWTGLTAITITNIGTTTQTFVFIDNAGNVVQTSTEPTPDERRDYILLGQIGHTNLTTIGAITNTPDFFVSPISQLRDMETAVGMISSGNLVSANGANLSINISAGTIYVNGANFFTDTKNPSFPVTGTLVAPTFSRRTQTGSGSSSTTLDVGNYDVAGTITAIPGTKATNQRVYLFPTNNVVIQYGQTLYNNLSNAIAGLSTETFVEYPNLTDNAILIGVISVMSNATDLSDITKAHFIRVSKFGEVSSGLVAASTVTLQQAYDNSLTPEITTDSTRGAMTLKRGSAADTDDVYEGQNGAGTKTFSVTGNGKIFSNDLTASQIVTTDSSKNLVSTALLPLSLGGTNKNMTASAGAVAYSDADSLELTAVGTTGQVLQSNGTSAPTWVNKPSVIRLSGNVTTTSDTASDITGFTLAVDANSVYRIAVRMRVGCNNTGGTKMGWNMPASTTVGFELIGRTTDAATQAMFGNSITVQTLGATAFNSANTTAGAIYQDLIITTGASSGTFALQFASTTNTQTSTIYADSSVFMWEKLA